MQFDEFMGQVQSRARLASTGEALRAVRATLETLSERLAGGAASNLAAELPSELQQYLPDREAERFDLDGFFSRVSEKEGEDLPQAVFHARVVIEVVREAVSAGAISKIREQLPDEYDPLFEAGSTGQLARNA
jgi:uncharacterized protein (DUF2267 family)